MIQFNLLPDVKLEYIRTKRTKRLVITVSVIVISACGFLLAVLAGTVYGLQRIHISNLTEDIEQDTRTIQEIEDINRVLTVQNQLNTINSLHDDKPVVSRLFDFITTITPSDVSINRLDVDFEESRIEISGETASLATVNKFVDTIKFTTYTVSVNGSDAEENLDNNGERAFSDVVLSSFGRANDETSYTIELSFDPVIFDSNQDVSLQISERITTRSEVERPQALFRTPDEEDNE